MMCTIIQIVKWLFLLNVILFLLNIEYKITYMIIRVSKTYLNVEFFKTNKFHPIKIQIYFKIIDTR